MIYFTADTHFGHANIIKMCERPFPDVETMNESMIAAWNERVRGNDTVYVVGDKLLNHGNQKLRHLGLCMKLHSVFSSLSLSIITRCLKLIKWLVCEFMHLIFL